MPKKTIAKNKSQPEVMTGTRLSTTEKSKGQIINYAELQRLLLQNVSKTTSRTYVQYTKENVQSYLQNPLSNIDNIRLVSQFLYRVSGPYKIIINYFANMGTFAYNVTHKTDMSKGVPDYNKIVKSYQTTIKRLEIMRLKDEMPNVIATALRDGAYFGFVCDDEETFFLNALDPKYCRISSIRDGVYDFSFNMSYFDQGNNSYFIDTTNNPDGVWPQWFIESYQAYKTQGRDYMWAELPPEMSICIISGDDPVCPLPYFANIFVSLLDLIDYESLLKNRTELENTVLLLSKIPLDSKSGEVNAFSVDLDLVQYTNDMIAEALPDMAAAVYSPCSVEKISFNNENQTSMTNYYAEAVSNLFSSVGISEMLFNKDKGGSVGLAASIKTDESLFFRFLSRIESWVKRYVYLNITEDFLFKFHYVTWFSKDNWVDTLKDAATLGLPVKMDYATALGYTPYQVMEQTLFESALGLDQYWTPLSSSYNGGQDEAGAPEKDDSELSDEGAATKDGGKNEGTKAKKSLNSRRKKNSAKSEVTE